MGRLRKPSSDYLEGQPPEQSSRQLNLPVRVRIIDKAFDLAKHLITCSAIVLVIYLIGRTISDLAGKTTLADIVIQILMSGNAREWASYAVTGGAILWGARERRLRKSTINHLSRRLIKTEEQLDPNRTSSHLTETGDTRPEDQ